MEPFGITTFFSGSLESSPSLTQPKKVYPFLVTFESVMSFDVMVYDCGFVLVILSLSVTSGLCL